MSQFDQLLKALNPAQREAVETIEGPVLVVAGPGTGKTQLLSMRAAAIVKNTDALPSNILCLTFTESAAVAMQQRLVKIMGSEGNRVAIHTFHSFGTEIINQNPEYFYGGANFTPADDMTSYELLEEIFSQLSHSNPLSKTINGEFAAIKDVQQAISHLKKAGLLPDELAAILNSNDTWCDKAEPKITQIFQDKRLSKKDFPLIEKLMQELQNLTPERTEKLYGFGDLATLCYNSLAAAYDQALATGKTTAITAWRNSWCEKNGQGKLVLKDRKQNKKLHALAKIYDEYRKKMVENQLFDFDDMVSNVGHTLEQNPELRFALQEQYLYIMVDEFQDTNGAQLRLLETLADSPVNEGRPNILAVGDDDQAIYAFQGAELSNIIDFTNRWRNVKIITLTDNYRSTTQILGHARTVIKQGNNRLETTLQNINKELNAHNTNPTITQIHDFTSPDAELRWVAESIAQRIKSGTEPNEIAVLARNHKQLVRLVPFLRAQNINITYERRDNILDQPQIRELLNLAETVVHLAEQRFDLVESHLPELLSYDFWNLKTTELWKLSIDAYKQKRFWLEIMLESDGKLKEIAEFLIVSSHQSLHEPLDKMLDILIGAQEIQVPDDNDIEPDRQTLTEDYISPYRAHYFNEQQLTQHPAEYLKLLADLRTLRRATKNYRPTSDLNLANLVDLMGLHQKTGTQIISSGQHSETKNNVTLMTAHKSKGLEFDTVYVINCQDEIWGRKTRHRNSSVNFPHNMPIKPAGTSYDDSLRLFFVAMTRAKHHLNLSWYAADGNGKQSSLAEFLHQNTLECCQHTDDEKAEFSLLTPGWEQRWLGADHATQQDLLAPVLEKYKLSATHLNNFIDVTRGGPQAFLLQNLLRFPQAMTPSQVFGQAIHAVLQRAHTHLAATGEQRPIEDILHDFEIQLQQSRLGESTFEQQLEKGSAVLQAYLAKNYHTFKVNQKAERNFYSQNILVNGAKLTGAIDLMEIDKTAKAVVVTDYKTGKGMTSWQGKTDFDKIKLHKYKQQLMFYKILVEESRDFAGYKVNQGVLEFVEPSESGDLYKLEFNFDELELENFKKLITAIWQKIINLDFVDTSKFEPTYKGILEFEKSLIDP
ncbi:MAG TPA: ATP-dependent DNA helicase [Candidatus Saccharimonadales bacterium]|nr:ATP-dependent DNA helicase [Candidatus Saccharimonadales bacterium]